jgi:hypothetical protein
LRVFGTYVQWFAQSRQWEGTDVIQEMIHSAGSIIEYEDGTTEEVNDGTPILLFCRNLGVVRICTLTMLFRTRFLFSFY